MGRLRDGNVMNQQASDVPPFDPPYFTFIEGEDGRAIETLADGTTRIVSRNANFPMGAPMSATPTSSGKKVATGIASPKSGSATAGKGAALLLNVPFAQKDQAKAIGAKWDADKKKWYVPLGLDINLFEAWWPDSLKQG